MQTQAVAGEFEALITTARLSDNRNASPAVDHRPRTVLAGNAR
jgi:hypothetical protein